MSSLSWTRTCQAMSWILIHRNYEIINVYCFEPLSLGIICYASIDNKYSSFKAITTALFLLLLLLLMLLLLTTERRWIAYLQGFRTYLKSYPNLLFVINSLEISTFAFYCLICAWFFKKTATAKYLPVKFINFPHLKYSNKIVDLGPYVLFISRHPSPLICYLSFTSNRCILKMVQIYT